MQKDTFGGYGFDYATTGTITASAIPNTGVKGWIAITALEAAQVDVTNTLGDSLTDVTIPAGATIYVTAVSITVDSGKIIAYRGGW